MKTTIGLSVCRPSVRVAVRSLNLVLFVGLVLAGAQAPAQPCTPAPTNMVAWWPGDGHTYDVINIRAAALQNGADYGAGLVGQAFSFNGPSEKVRIAESSRIDISRASRWTIEGWVRPTSFINSTYPTIYSEGNKVASLGLNSSGNLESWINNNSAILLVGTNALSLGAWNHVALVRDGALRSLYVNGVLAGATNSTPNTTADSTGSAIGNVTIDDPNGAFQGEIDEVSLYFRALSAAEIVAIKNAASGGKCYSTSNPAFVIQPESQTNYLGADATFTGLAMGSPRPTYQWWFNGTNQLAGKTNYTLSLTNLSFANDGNYTLVAGSGADTITSSVARLTVRFCAGTPAGLIAWWPGDGSGLDATSNHNGAVWGAMTYPPGVVTNGPAFGLNGTDAYLAVPDSPALSPHAGTNGEMTVEAWVHLTQQSPTWTTVLAKSDPSRWEYALHIDPAGVPYFYVWSSDGSTNIVASGGVVTLNQWHHLVGTFRQGQFIRLYQNAVLMGESTNATINSAHTATPLYLGRRHDGYFFKGRLDEVALYSRALDANEIATLYAADTFGKCAGGASPAPFFAVQPASQSGYYFLGANLSALALGTPRPSYQWYRSNTPSMWITVAGATNGTLGFTNLSENVMGFYRVSASNVYGSVTSSPAWLEVACHPIVCSTNGETFENGWNGWTTDSSVWQIGVPSSGPGSAHQGSCVAGTVLNGDYPNNSDARLISPPVIIPSADLNPRLRFWHWFSIDAGGGDYAHCYQRGDYGIVYVIRTNGAWEAVSSEFYHYSDWTRASIDLRAYAGQKVSFAFYFYANCSYTSSGWYIDEVKVETGPYLLPRIEGFEQGLGDWSAYRGNWQVGVPQTGTGPGRAHSGTKCAGVVLNGAYPNNVSTYLVSPRAQVPPASDNPRLRFWHWFSIDAGGGDYAHCYQRGDYGAVYVVRTNGAWDVISPEYYYYSDWTEASLDLTAYAGQPVQFAFYFYANCSYQSSGWFIDDVEVVTNRYEIPPGELEDFELGLGDWAADRGNWQVGVPAGGPGAAHQGTNCAAVGLSGTYANNVSSSLISPWVAVPSAAQNPRLRFWHWFSIDSGGGDYAHCYQGADYGQVYVWLTNGVQETISPSYNNYSDWTRASLDLRKYAGQRVRFMFYFYANCSYPSSGWYIDEVKVETGPYLLPPIEGFEQGLGDWSAYRGNWQVGVPQTGPWQAHSGTNCAGVVLNGSYPNNVDTYLVSPRTQVPPASANPHLRFWHWFSIDAGGGDYAHCYQRGDYGTVYVVRTNGAWDVISPEYYNYSDWTEASLPLTNYAGEPVQFAFRFYANCSYQSSGWFIDDLFIKRGGLAIASINSKTNNELTPLAFQATVIGAQPNACLSFSLGSSAPSGASIDPETGVFTWTPSECQGPGVYNIPIYVVDYCNGEENDLRFVKVTVNEVNQPPWLMAGEGTAYVGQTNSWTLCSGDPDCPANPLAYSLLAPVPAGMTIGGSPGAIRWVPTAAQVGSSTVTVRLCDGGSPNYCVTNKFTIGVTPNAPYSLAVDYLDNGDLQFTILNGLTTVNYTLQQTASLCDCSCQTIWQPVGTVSPTTVPYTFVYPRAVFGGADKLFFRLDQVPRP